MLKLYALKRYSDEMTRSIFTGTYSHKTPMPNCCGPKPDITMSGLHLLTLSLMIVINIGSAEHAPGKRSTIKNYLQAFIEVYLR